MNPPKRGGQATLNEADLGSLDSDTESQCVSLSGIQGVNDDYDEVSTSLVNEFKIKAKKTSTPTQNMLFLPQLSSKSGVRIRTSRLGCGSDGQNHHPASNHQMKAAFFESDEMRRNGRQGQPLFFPHQQQPAVNAIFMEQ